MDRRQFLISSAATSAGVLTVPAAFAGPAQAATVAVTSVTAFVDDYTTNTGAHLTPDTNAAIRILTGMQKVWQTGTAWNTGVPLMPEVLRANVRYCTEITTRRTADEAKLAFIIDRRDQSYSSADGLGPLASLYRSGALSVTSITTAPDSTPATKIDDAVPAGAPAGSTLGAGSPTSDLGLVVQLVNTLRGNYASGNPSKSYYQYPRPWRLNQDSAVVDTGAIDAYGFPVYSSTDVVAPQLLRQRSTTPATDGGFVSGHTNALYLAALAYAYAVPERFQELLACASAYSHARIVAGMHSPVDVVGGRTLATALAAATLADPANATLKAAARSQALAYFQARTGTTPESLIAYAHSATRATDPFADRAVNAAAWSPRLTYIVPRKSQNSPFVTPKGAEVLLETRQPYLTAGQRREVLRTTALPAYVLIDGPEEWGRLNLFAAADGYGALDSAVVVTQNAADGGFSAADTWRNPMGGPGSLTKRGTGSLTLAGTSSYRGGTVVDGGTLVAGSPRALGAGAVRVASGTLSVAAGVPGAQISGCYDQAAGSVLGVTLTTNGQPALCVSGTATISRGSTLDVRLDPAHLPPYGVTLPVLSAGAVQGTFSAVTVSTPGYRATALYTRRSVSVRLTAR